MATYFTCFVSSALRVAHVLYAEAGEAAPKSKKRKLKENEPPVAPARSSRRMQGIKAEIPAGISMGEPVETLIEVRENSFRGSET